MKLEEPQQLSQTIKVEKNQLKEENAAPDLVDYQIIHRTRDEVLKSPEKLDNVSDDASALSPELMRLIMNPRKVEIHNINKPNVLFSSPSATRVADTMLSVRSIETLTRPQHVKNKNSKDAAVRLQVNSEINAFLDR